MKYRNPIIPGFFPDPSICTDGKKYYLVCSSFQYFPGVPLFESENLIEWKQLGNVLTRKSQLPLTHAKASQGIFAPVIRYHEGRFYMITTNTSDGGNFFVYTDDIHGEWSDPVWLDLGGIDPSLCFADGRVFFTGTGADENGRAAVVQCELDIETGTPINSPRCIWTGTGGRYLEGPHLYQIGGAWYLLAAEGGTEYGHMEVCARSENPYGPFETQAKNPFLTNRDLGGYALQGAGHMDLVRDFDGNYWGVHLAFRQLDKWLAYHTIGRETCLVPVEFDAEGNISAGENGTARLIMETDRRLQGVWPEKTVRSFADTRAGREWIFVRNPNRECYELSTERFVLKGNGSSINDSLGSPTLVAIRQEQLYEEVVCKIKNVRGEAGLTAYMDNAHHYDLSVRNVKEGCEAFCRICIGAIRQEQSAVTLSGEGAELTLRLECAPTGYRFFVEQGNQSYALGGADSRYLSSEVAGGFTGAVIGLYAEADGGAEFTEFEAVAYCDGKKE